MSGAKIIDGLKDAIDGNISRITIEGQTWLRATDLASDLQEIMRINNEMLDLLIEALNTPTCGWPDWVAKVRAKVRE